jgi:hypothetical protein
MSSDQVLSHELTANDECNSRHQFVEAVQIVPELRKAKIFSLH